MNACDDCGRPGAILVDLADGAQLCRHCADAYEPAFRRDRFRTRLPLANLPTVHRRHS
jgi:hypothetical protein